MAEYLTGEMPGIGGSIKEVPADFRVEEIPLYHPCGSGEHLYVQIEKEGLSTFELLSRLARRLGVKERELGYAGMKDARATTRQTISIPGARPEQLLGLVEDGYRVLDASLHRNKLRLGHLAGNRFVIRIRQPLAGALPKAQAILEVLAARGVPNAFGQQRYGVLGTSHLAGRALLCGDYPEVLRQVIGAPETIANPQWQQAARHFLAGEWSEALAVLPGRFRQERAILQALLEGRSPQHVVMGLPTKLLRLYLSAYQSYLFDRLLGMRLPDLGLLRDGDLAVKHGNGAYFTVNDAALEQSRADLFEISPSAPLFGYKVPLAAGEPGRQEEGLLAAEGLTPASFRLPGALALVGERRPLRVPLGAVEVKSLGEDLQLSFSLPPGCYATIVLREVMKAGLGQQRAGGDDDA
jgi:tRNA pseudouridine13 synthase